MDRKLRADLALMFLFADLGRHVKNALDHTAVFVFLAVMAAFRPSVLAKIDREEIFAGLRVAFFMFAG